ncbi:MAG: hypothetical protein ABI602_03860 [Candidatus Saccharibacteria bacterium]
MSENVPADAPYQERLEVETNRRLLSIGQAARLGFQEYVDTALNTRVISLPADKEREPSPVDLHYQLRDKGLPVFPAMYQDDRLLLKIPEGTRPLPSLLKFIARDIPNYGNVFLELGGILHRMHAAGMGLPSQQPDRDMLDNFAFVTDDSDVYGGTIYLTPPYQVNVNRGIDEEIDDLQAELIESMLFTDSEVTELLAKTLEGWNDALSE